MSYVAMHFVKINGRMYTQGEIIDEVMEESKKLRLLEHGAIHEIAPVPQPETIMIPIKEKTAEKTIPEEPAEEADDAADAPEIDIMDGIVGTTKTTKRRRTKA